MISLIIFNKALSGSCSDVVASIIYILQLLWSSLCDIFTIECPGFYELTCTALNAPLNKYLTQMRANVGHGSQGLRKGAVLKINIFKNSLDIWTSVEHDLHSCTVTQALQWLGRLLFFFFYASQTCYVCVYCTASLIHFQVRAQPVVLLHISFIFPPLPGCTVVSNP